MTYYEIVGEILSRVNDPLGDTYLERSKQLMFEGINMLAYNGDYVEEDIPGMLRNSIVVQSTSSLLWSPESDGGIGGGQVLKILEITNAYEATPKYSYKRVDGEYLNKMTRDSEYEALSNEIFYTLNKYSLNFYDITDGNPEETTPTGIRFYPLSRIQEGVTILIKFIQSPNPSAWTYGSSLTSVNIVTSGYLSLPYIYKVIDYSVAKLNQEVAGS